MLQLIRETPIRVVSEGTLSSRRGFLFYIAAGFSKEVDPLSGMSVDLVQVDNWLAQAVERFGQGNFEIISQDFHGGLTGWAEAIRQFLDRCAQEDGATLTSLCFREERGWSFSWQPELSSGQWIYSYSHFIESIPLTGAFDLLKINFNWLRVEGCSADLQYEGFKLLKPMTEVGAQDIIESLRDLWGKRLASGTVLNSIDVDYLGEKFSVKI